MLARAEQTTRAPTEADEDGTEWVSIPDVCGPSWWAMIHAWAESIRDSGCSSCGTFAVKAVSALHDLVNLKVGKELHDRESFIEVASKYADALNRIGRDHGTPAPMAQDVPIPVRITGKCSGDAQTCQFKVKAVQSSEAATGAISMIPDVVQQVRRRLEQARGEGSNTTFAFGSLSGTRYEFRYRILDVSQIVTSNDPFTFVATPGYPRELQPRQRDRASLRLQVEQLAANLDPELLLTDFHSLDRGAPIIGPDLSVESGNGRAMAIRRAVEQHPEVFNTYRSAIEDRASRFGLRAEDLSSVQNPILVRERLTDVDRIDFVQEANLSPAVSSSAVETALTDAQFITPTLVRSLFVGENQGIEEALRSTRNTPFTSGFLAALPSQEQAKLVDANGRLNQDGVRRITMALFARAFKGESGLRLAEHFFESVDANVKNVFNGILSALGPLVESETMAETGERDPELAIGEDLAKSVAIFSTIKATPGATVESFLAQGQLFENPLTPFQEVVLQDLDERSRSSRRIAELLRAYATIVASQPPPSQGSLIDVARITKDQAWEQARRATLEPATGTLFQTDGREEFILTERSTAPGLRGIIPPELASLKVQTRLVRSRAFDPEKSPQIDRPEALQPLVRLMRDADREFLLAIFADTKNRVIAMLEVNVGQRAASLVDFDAILRAGVLSGAATVFLAHNHPSGDPTPSPEDRKLFQLARDQCSLLDLEFVEMLIVGKTQDFSMAGGARLPAPTGRMGQEIPKVRISGKCEGQVDESCEFRVKRVEKTVKAQGVQAAVDAAVDLLSGPETVGPRATGQGPTEVRPLTVQLAGGTFNLAPETVVQMTEVANNTSKRERGFALCEDPDGLVRPGLRCLGGKCSIRITDCRGRKNVGQFHTHPSDQPSDPEVEAVRQRNFSTTDLTPLSSRAGRLQCVSGAKVPIIHCAVSKPGADLAVKTPRRGSYPYLHPNAPERLRNEVTAVVRTRTGRKSSNQNFFPEIGAQYDFVEFDKVGAARGPEQAELGQDDGLSEFAKKLDLQGSGDFVSELVADPGEFEEASIRTVTQGDHRILVGCPVGHWDGRRCDIGTRARNVLHPRSESAELVDDAESKGIPVIGDSLMEHLDEMIQVAMEV